MAADYPEDWQEQGWCCRECALTSWNAMSPEMRSLFLPVNNPKDAATREAASG